MDLDLIFSTMSQLAMPFWLLIVLAPRWRFAERIIRSPWIVAPFAIGYAVLVLPLVPALLPVLAASRLDAVAALLATPEGATLGWLHFLAFDLFVGRWIYLDSRERNFSAVLMAPVLLSVLMFGPLGLLIYLSGRAIVGAGTGRQLNAEGGSKSGLRGAVSAPLSAFRAGVRINAPLTYSAVAMLPLLALTVIGIIVDPRVITGAPAWLKPAKFAASLGIYAFTLLWLLGRVKGKQRLVWIIGTASAVAVMVEWVVVALQAFRGTTSHFNVATRLDWTLFSVMGIFVVMIWVANLVAAILLIRQPETDQAFGWSLRLGLVTALVGGAMGGAMLAPTTEQVATMGSGSVTTVGAHTVGAADGGPGMPITGWSTVAGDVRVPHFFGLHGLQILPLAGWLISRSRRFPAGQKVKLVVLSSLGYLSFTGILFWQAMRGESVVAPGPATVISLAALLLSVLLAGIAITRYGNSRESLGLGAGQAGVA